MILVELLTETLTEEGGADGAMSERGWKKKDIHVQELLTSSQCGGCRAAFLSPSSSQSGSDSDGILSSLL